MLGVGGLEQGAESAVELGLAAARLAARDRRRAAARSAPQPPRSSPSTAVVQPAPRSRNSTAISAIRRASRAAAGSAESSAKAAGRANVASTKARRSGAPWTSRLSAKVNTWPTAPGVKRKACTVAGGTTSAHGPSLVPAVLVEPVGDFAGSEHEDLAQAVMDVAADLPIVALRTRGDLLDMDEVVVVRGRRLAIEGKCRRSAGQIVAGRAAAVFFGRYFHGDPDLHPPRGLPEKYRI